MKNIKQVLIISVLTISTAFLLLNCRKEPILLDKQEQIQTKISPFKSRTHSFEDFKKEITFQKAIESLNRKGNINSRTVMEDEYGFSIDSTSVLELTTDNYISYTMKINRDESNSYFVENLLIEIDSSNTPKASIVSYLPTEQWIENHNAGIEQDFEGSLTIQPINYNTESSQTSRMDCIYVYVETTHYCNGVVHDYPDVFDGLLCAACGRPAGSSNSWTTSELVVQSCWNSGGSGGYYQGQTGAETGSGTGSGTGATAGSNGDGTEGATPSGTGLIENHIDYVMELAYALGIINEGELDDNPNPEFIQWYNNTRSNLSIEQIQSLLDFIISHSDESDAQEFVNEMIFHFERLDAPLITIETPEFKNEICAKQIKDDVISTLRIQKIISKFKPNRPVLHLEWGIFESIDWSNTGHTSLNDSQTSAIIELNKNSFDNITNIVLVETIAHEIIHAELYRKLKELVDDYSIISLSEYVALENNYLGIADYVFRYGNLESTTFGSQILTWGLTPNYSLAHHNQIADYYRDVLIDTMKAYDDLKGIDRGQNAEEFYEALSWMGLRSYSDNGTTSYYDAWQQFVNQIDIDEANIPQDQRTYSRYENIIQSQINTTPTTTGIGINCN